MHRRLGYITRFALVFIGFSLILSLLFYAAFSYLFTDAFNQSEKKALNQTLESGEKLLTAYSNGEISFSQLWDLVNPSFRSENSFLMLMDRSGGILAYTDSAVPYLVNSQVREIIHILSDSSSSQVSTEYSVRGAIALIAGKIVREGYIIAGRTHTEADSLIYSFRTQLLSAMLITLFVILFFSSIGARILSRPVKKLFEASEQLIYGESVEMSENMPGEMQNIAKAFNTMSRKIASSIQEVSSEKENMRLILESLNEGIIAMDARGVILHKNSAATSLLGGDETPQALEIISAIRQVIALQKEGNTEQVLTGKTRREGRELLYAVSPLPNRPGHSPAAVALIRDITEQERLEMTRHDYVANISHELRTPLASIKGIAEGIRDGMVTSQEDMNRCVGIIVDEATRLSRLVNDLLELSGLQSNPAAFDMEEVDPVELVLELSDRNQSLYREAGITLSCSLPSDADGNIAPLPMIVSNEDRLSEVLTIFIDNARKYTPAGGSVTLGAELTGDGVRFFVADNGIGMDEETQRLAFDRFHQAEKSHSGKGSGLGLAIAKEIMDKMDIPIRLKSEPGKGSEFSFTVPAEQPPEAPEGPPRLPAQAFPRDPEHLPRQNETGLF